MNRSQLIQDFESTHLKDEIPQFQIGDTVRVHTRIVEGQKERIQVFMGTVIARKGFGLSETFSVYRNAYGSSMERVFLLHSPKVAKIELVKKGKVRRAKLYYLRGRSGKAAKVKEHLGIRSELKVSSSKKAAPAVKNEAESAPSEENETK
ncbi:MAG: 50S ribosomal protein L19 [Chlamydiota bacterium]|jgi:large subunit ribosomal protein L19